MLYVRHVILKTIPEVVERYSYNAPFYNIDKKPMLYLNVLKGTDYVDVAFVHGVIFEKDFPILKNHKNRKQVRSIQLKNIEELDEIQFVELLKLAVQQTKKNKQSWFLDD
jgi:hypothetical protein